jgi:hypothetical protein
MGQFPKSAKAWLHIERLLCFNLIGHVRPLRMLMQAGYLLYLGFTVVLRALQSPRLLPNSGTT